MEKPTPTSARRTPRRRPPPGSAFTRRRLGIALVTAALLTGAGIAAYPGLRFLALRREYHRSEGVQRETALLTMLRMGTPTVVPILLEEAQLSDGRDRYLDVLLELLGEEHLPLLLDQLRGDDRPRRAVAAYVLVETWDRPWVGGSEEVRAGVALLYAGLFDGLSGGAGAQDYVHQIQRLRESLPEADILGPLLSGLRAGPAQDRENALRVVYYLRGDGDVLSDPRVREEVVGSLASEDVRVRLVAALILDGVAGPEEVPPLVEASRDADPRVRRVACAALGGVGGDTAIEALLERLSDEERDVSERAALSLGQLQVERIIPELLEMLGQTRVVRIGGQDGPGMRVANPFPSEAAAEALGYFAREDVIDALIEVVKDEEIHDRVRRQSMLSLGRIGDDLAVPALVPALGDDEWPLRHAAIQALASIGGKEAAIALIARVRVAAERELPAPEMGALGEALRRITRREHGPREGDGLEGAARAVARWERWLEEGAPMDGAAPEEGG